MFNTNVTLFFMLIWQRQNQTPNIWKNYLIRINSFTHELKDVVNYSVSIRQQTETNMMTFNAEGTGTFIFPSWLVSQWRLSSVGNSKERLATNLITFSNQDVNS